MGSARDSRHSRQRVVLVLVSIPHLSTTFAFLLFSRLAPRLPKPTLSPYHPQQAPNASSPLVWYERRRLQCEELHSLGSQAGGGGVPRGLRRPLHLLLIHLPSYPNTDTGIAPLPFPPLLPFHLFGQTTSAVPYPSPSPLLVTRVEAGHRQPLPRENAIRRHWEREATEREWLRSQPPQSVLRRCRYQWLGEGSWNRERFDAFMPSPSEIRAECEGRGLYRWSSVMLISEGVRLEVHALLLPLYSPI